MSHDHVKRLFGTPQPVALVTGSGSPRIGNCVARRLASGGYRLVIHANHSRAAAEQTAAELKSEHGDAIAVVGDLTDESVVEKIFNQIDEYFGRIDVLVNCASTWQQKQLEQISADDVRHHFEVNCLATFLCCQRAGLRMVDQEMGGAIVNFGDWATARPYRDYSAYFPSKGAIGALTRNFAVELATRNPRIRVNAVLPGPVMMPRDLPVEEREAAISATLVKREGNPENVAEAVRFLIENDFVTGVCLPIDGGRSLFAA